VEGGGGGVGGRGVAGVDVLEGGGVAFVEASEFEVDGGGVFEAAGGDAAGKGVEVGAAAAVSARRRMAASFSRRCSLRQGT
jgi:hypothetical protein